MMSYIVKGTQSAFETALAWTLVLSLLKSVYLNPKSKLRVVDIYKIRFNRALWFFWSLIFYSKPVPEYYFSHLLKLFYRVCLKRIQSSVQWNMDRRGGKREGAGRKKSPALTKTTREINQKHWRANHHSIYLENRVFSSWKKIRAEGTFSNDSAFASWLLGLELRRRQENEWV